MYVRPARMYSNVCKSLTRPYSGKRPAGGKGVCCETESEETTQPIPLNRLGIVMKKPGYMQKCLRGKVRGWLVQEREMEEINANRSIEGKG